MSILLLIGALGAAFSLPGEIAYIDRAAGVSGAVFVLDGDAGTPTQVGPGRQDGPPQWSPDGAWLLFETTTDRGRGLYVVRPTGAEGRWLETELPWNTAPCWSTDGARIAYSSAPQRGAAGELRVYDLNRNEETVWGNGRVGMIAPKWMPYSKLMFFLSPDRALVVPGVDMDRFLSEARLKLLHIGARELPQAILALEFGLVEHNKKSLLRPTIVLVSQHEVLPLLDVVDPIRTARHAGIDAVTPNWSDYDYALDARTEKAYGGLPLDDPGETTRIAFESNEDGDREIYVLGKKGIANVTNHRAADWNPVWSPDGKTMAFESFRGGHRGIYEVYSDTAHVKTVAAEPGVDSWSPGWSPDGQYIVYVSDATGQPELFATAERGLKTVQLTRDGGPKEAPAWRPEVPR